ncbi:VPS10 domain-containing protein [Alterisphingorhabdus coralli]|uniref:Glycosyl hydrolase n=1 Tax=Alterisphingorhabdus coralli TaxID=3071408 RepID=A0AA97F909_9SPHN|nr:glycosyl hydrolase [Parasphingorhabdus sp. SCSIO 66989]WOE74695.1 glycosyl hydrolase [Parasphingorhabdus sp. SCSIO 66989]
MKITKLLIALMLALGLGSAAIAQSDEQEEQPPLSSKTFDAFKLRGIGPAFMSGRIADIAIVQDDPATWYVAVGSGGVWKTENAGTTWVSLFDGQGSYSIGALGLDPSDPNRIWVGTGENNGGRHIGFGDGIYRSNDGGKTWEKLGLEASEHISKIIVHPEDSNTVWVAAQGPLWSPGGERGVFKTSDGGKTWEKTLSSGPYTGATDLLIDPRDPDRLYAAMWQHQRTVATYVGGGPESGLWKSEDGGESWTELKTGLPQGNMGKIGLTLSPMRPDIVYAAIEEDQRKGGVWRSTNRGASWEKMSDEVGQGTGPHYYQELYASPHVFDRIYLVSNTSQISNDGGKTWTPLNNEHKHVDDHAIAFRPDDPDYILFGSDGGLYESYDHTKTWRFINNLPITQFYKVAVDDAEPFYFVYGGTQDNNSQGGPSRTDNRHGIRNDDWFITLFADGHQSATEPGNPDIMYAEWQQGNLARVDRITGEVVHIQPQPSPGDPIERWNWDSPIFVSQHQPTRLYFASQRVWRSDNRGDSWTPISGDLTRDQDRLKLPVQGRQWSWEAGWDLLAMSQYNTITSLGESPIDENILYAGTDDGLIQISENGGASWRKVEVGSLPGVPDTAFVNDIRADLFDANTVYIALDNHKYGDYKPYLLKSTNRGRSWSSITGDIPDRHLIWRVVQDHVNPSLLFSATEFGMFFTLDGGRKWVKLTGDAPTISFRDLTIQRREDDLVGASFGRGFFIVDDISPLRTLSEASLNQEAMLFPGRKAHWYIEQHPLAFNEGGSQGHSYFRAPNPPFGANFTYYLADDVPSLQEARQKREKPLAKEGKDTPFPGFDTITAELQETAPTIWLTVRNSDGNIVRRLKGPAKKGFHRVNWDLRYPDMSVAAPVAPDGDEPTGFLVSPGEYTVSLSKRVRGQTTELVGPKPFTVARLRDGALPPKPDAAEFWAEIAQFDRSVSATASTLSSLEKKVGLLAIATERAQGGDPVALDNQWQAIRNEVFALEAMLNGNKARNAINERTQATVRSRLGVVMTGLFASTHGPTQTHRDQFGYAKGEFDAIRNRLNTLTESAIPAFEAELLAAGAPWVPGGKLP